MAQPQTAAEIDKIRTSLALGVKQAGFSGDISPIMTAIELNNHHGYVSQNTKIQTENVPVSSGLPSVSEVLASLPVTEKAEKAGKLTEKEETGEKLTDNSQNTTTLPGNVRPGDTDQTD